MDALDQNCPRELIEVRLTPSGSWIELISGVIYVEEHLEEASLLSQSSGGVGVDLGFWALDWD